MEQSLKQCPFCGQHIPAKAVKCRYCAEFVTDFKPEGAMIAQSQFKPPHKMSACLIIVIIAVAIIGAIAVIAVIAIPSISSHKELAPGTKAISYCKQLATAEEMHYVTYGSYGTLKALTDNQMLSPEFSGGILNGFRFKLDLSADMQDWSFRMWPENPGRNRQSYYINSTAEIRAQDYSSHSDEKAGPDSPLLWGDADWGN